MKMELIELERDCTQNCCVIKDDEYEQLKNRYVIDAVADELFVLQGEFSLPFFLKYGECANDSDFYFIIRNIHNASASVQSMYHSLIKDRYLNSCGYLMENFTFVLTVDNEKSLSMIIPELYRLCVVCL